MSFSVNPTVWYIASRAAASRVLAFGADMHDLPKNGLEANIV
jgi:hypothetical protein